MGLTRESLLTIRAQQAVGRNRSPTTASGSAAKSINITRVAFHRFLQLAGAVRLLVDATAADTHAMLEIVLERGWDVVLANKVTDRRGADA